MSRRRAQCLAFPDDSTPCPGARACCRPRGSRSAVRSRRRPADSTCTFSSACPPTITPLLHLSWHSSCSYSKLQEPPSACHKSGPGSLGPVCCRCRRATNARGSTVPAPDPIHDQGGVDSKRAAYAGALLHSRLKHSRLMSTLISCVIMKVAPGEYACYTEAITPGRLL